MKNIVYVKRANYFLFKIVVVAVLFVLLAGAVSFFGIKRISKTVASQQTLDTDKITIVIDAGHGGIDAGAEVSGIYEKDLNLAISQRICDFLSLYNVKCILTRDKDILLAEESAKRKKQSDLLNRVNVARSCESPVFVSIHMNKFPIEKYSGLQVFYSGNNSLSETLAEIIQTNVVKNTQNDNNRKIKEAGSAIYVLDRLSCPAVLVECGFMSNKTELSLLSTPDYQDTLAYIISVSILQFLSLQET